MNKLSRFIKRFTKRTIIIIIALIVLGVPLIYLRDLRIFTFFNGLFSSNIHQKNNNQKQSSSNLESGNIICQINHNNSSSFSSVKTPTFQHIIAPKILNINTLISLVIGIAAKNTTTKFELTAENIFNWELVIVNINNTLARIKYHVNL